MERQTTRNPETMCWVNKNEIMAGGSGVTTALSLPRWRQKAKVRSVGRIRRIWRRCAPHLSSIRDRFRFSFSMYMGCIGSRAFPEYRFPVEYRGIGFLSSGKYRSIPAAELFNLFLWKATGFKRLKILTREVKRERSCIFYKMHGI
jgi:hypothetical protein